jgi:putative transposase
MHYAMTSGIGSRIFCPAAKAMSAVRRRIIGCSSKPLCTDIDPGKPWQNGAAESFNGKFRDECLSLEWFRSRAEAKVIIESWRRHYNQVRPHSSLGYLTPAEFAAKINEHDAASGKATGRTAAVSGASALRPVASPSRKGHDNTEPRVVVSS